MATKDARRTAAATVTGSSRRGGRPLSAGERRDVRWALTLEPSTHTHAVDVHGVYVVYRHTGRQEPVQQPKRQPRSNGDEDVAMANDEPKRKPRRRESAARMAKKEARFQDKVKKWAFLSVMPHVGAWIRREQQQRECEATAAAAAAARYEARERQLKGEKLALERALAHAQQQAEEMHGEARRWRARAEGRDDRWAPPLRVQPVPDDPMDDDSASVHSASTSGDTRRSGGTPPPKRPHSHRDDRGAAKEERRLLLEASEEMVSKGSTRGKGKGKGRGGASGGGRGGWGDGGRGGAPPPPTT